MSARNTTKAAVLWNGVKAAKIRDIQWSISRANLETTGIGDADDSYIYGKRTTTASGTLLYDPTDAATVALMNRILSDADSTDTILIKTETGSSQGELSGEALISSQGVPLAVGELISCQISFSISGGTSGSF